MCFREIYKRKDKSSSFFVKEFISINTIEYLYNNNIYMAKRLSRSLSFCILERMLTCIFFVDSRCIKAAYARFNAPEIFIGTAFIEQEDIRDKFTLKVTTTYKPCYD